MLRVCSGVEDVSSGVVLPESADGWSWFAVGTVSAHSAHPDGFYLHLSVAVQHPAGVPLSSRRRQGGQGRYLQEVSIIFKIYIFFL